MKSERRHELKTNSLSQGLEGLPDYWREYGNKVLLVIIVGLIAYLAVRYWNDKKRRDAEQLISSLETVRTQLAELDQLQMSEAVGSGIAAADARQRISSAANDAISTLLSTAKDPNIIAHAYLAQGDLDWKLANTPDPAGATTRPELKITNRDGLLSGAAEAYAKILEPPYSTDALDVFTARMGLAAIAENQAKFDDAKKQYQAIADSTAFPNSFKEIASARLKDLPEYQKPALLAPPPDLSASSTAPATPSILGPEAPMLPTPTTIPTTLTAPPSSFPASQPAAIQPQ